MNKTMIAALALAFATPALAQTTSNPSANEIRAENCMVKFINNVNVPAEVEGKLMELKFDEGSTVAAGEIMAVIDDTQAKFALELKKAEEREALLNATNDVNLKDSKNAKDLAVAELEAFKELRREGAIPFWELEKKRFEATRAELKIDLAEMQMQIAKVQFKAKESERQMAEYEVKKRRITAPFAGYIESRIAQLGEWVQPGSPIATLIQLDQLKVEGDIDALRYPGQVVKGTPVQVLVYREANNENPVAFDGQIDFVGSEIDLNNHYRVAVNIENKQLGGQWMVKPGMRAEIIVLK
ncbi:efflux RND transporter periplasmic adaptor subunit [Novipirellula sp. SH528]|uniref:efflux RND transporter periplasmic adaptor subunit n=1 Tax=Novipirellula sp. SH528 TaxID=3454466 RepID=UPI003F9FEABF